MAGGDAQGAVFLFKSVGADVRVSCSAFTRGLWRPRVAAELTACGGFLLEHFRPAHFSASASVRRRTRFISWFKKACVFCKAIQNQRSLC